MADETIRQEQDMIGYYSGDLMRIVDESFDHQIGSPRPEIEARVQFDMNYLGPAGMSRLFQAETFLRSLDIKFDTGAGNGARDWEMDWSLKGPVRIRLVRFRGRLSFWQCLEILFTGNINPRSGVRVWIRDQWLKLKYRKIAQTPSAIPSEITG